jgi:hypothetical protein
VRGSPDTLQPYVQAGRVDPVDQRGDLVDAGLRRALRLGARAAGCARL